MTPLTPLELMENQACAHLAEVVASLRGAAQPGTYDAGWVDAAEKIRAQIAERVKRHGVARDPFATCSIPGCTTETLGAFCKPHIAKLDRPHTERLLLALLADDRPAYRTALAEAIALIQAAA